MRAKSLLTACLITMSSVGLANADTIMVNSWDELQNNQSNLNNDYVYGENVSVPPYGEYRNIPIEVGKDASESGYWNLTGPGKDSNPVDGHWKHMGFYIKNTVNSATFTGLNITQFQDTMGAVFQNFGNNLSIVSSKFERNGQYLGGVLYNGGTVSEIDDSIFNRNFVDNGNGGAIYNAAAGTIDTIKNSVFTNNTVYYSSNKSLEDAEENLFKGGSIYNAGTINNIKDSTFTNNGKDADGNGRVDHGGAIYNKGSIGTIGNAADGASTLGTVFTSNQSEKGGGAIYNDTDGKIENIVNTKFDNNFVQNQGFGGALYNAGEITNIKDSEFVNNHTNANNGDASLGGAIYNTGIISNILNTKFGNSDNYRSGNSAHMGGGAIYNATGAQIGLIKGSEFNYNTLTWDGKDGAAISNNGTITTIEDTKFGNNGHNINGAVGNNYANRGGAIFNAQGAQIGDIKGSTVFSYNQAVNGGAAIYNEGNISNINAEFNNNFVQNSNGAAIYNAAGATIGNIQSKFTANGKDNETYASVGGAIYNQGTIGSVVLDGDTPTEISGGIVGSEFTGNISKYGGGAVHNEGVISKISSVFRNNYTGGGGGGDNDALIRNAGGGAAIKNKNGTIYQITESLFEGNYSDTNLTGQMSTPGGAIHNHQYYGINSKIGEISDSQFYSNFTTDLGGAIANSGRIDTIKGVTFGEASVTNESGESVFRGNRASAGGAINNYQYGQIGTISDSEFNYNVALENSDHVQGNGGAIRNSDNAEIGEIIDSKFNYNVAGGLKEEYQSGNYNVMGGAIYNDNSSRINTISGTEFTNNMVIAGWDSNRGYNGYGYGGAVYNGENSTIGSISDVTFENNTIHDSDGAHGGALYNKGNINGLNNVTFKNNGIYGLSYGNGGAIYNEGTIGNIDILDGMTGEVIGKTGISGRFEGNFVGKVTQGSDGVEHSDIGYGHGSAVYNTSNGVIGDINADFIGNSAVVDSQYTHGGTINNQGTINLINGKYENNSYTNLQNSEYAASYGGVIGNDGWSSLINSITGEFRSNSLNSVYGGGAAISNTGTIGTIKADFIGNTATIHSDGSSGSSYGGGAIYNNHYVYSDDSVAITSIEGRFENNSFINEIEQSSISNNSYYNGGGAIYNYYGSLIKSISGEFINNSASGGVYGGGAIYSNGDSSTIEQIRADFTGNSVTKTIADSQGLASGGAIHDATFSSTLELINSSFKDNYVINKAEGEHEYAVGGAISTYKGLTITADGARDDYEAHGPVVFSGNYTQDSRGKIANAIFINTQNSSSPESKVITLNAVNGGTIQFDDQIDGARVSAGYGFKWANGVVYRGEEYLLKLTGGDVNDNIILNNDMINAKAELENINLTIGVTDSENKVSNVFGSDYTSFNAKSGNISTIDNKMVNYNINKLTSSSDANWSIDVDWDNLTSDTITLGDKNSANALADKNSTGSVSLAALNILNNTANYPVENLDEDGYAKIQVLKGAQGSETDSRIQLNIDNLELVKVDPSEPYVTEVKSSQLIGNVDTDIKLGTTDTLNDSLAIKGTLYDTLEYICTLETKNGESKTFLFDDKKPVYTYAKSDLAVVGDLTISGDSTSEAIDFSNKTNFTVGEDAKLSISNASIINAAGLINKGDFSAENAKFTGIENFQNDGSMKFADSTIDSTLTNNNSVEFSGNNKINAEITGGGHGVVNFVDGTPVIANKISNQSMINTNANINITDLGFINNNNNSLTMNGGVVNLPGLGLNTLVLNRFNMNGGVVNVASVDVDLANKVMGNISAPDSLASTGGLIDVKSMNILSDALEDRTDINFANGKFASQVVSSVETVETQYNRYDVSYNRSNGNFSFVKGTGLNGVNQGLLASGISTQVGGYISQLATVEHSFYHIDTWGMLPQKARFTQNGANKYAISDMAQGKYYDNTNKGIWFRPYTSFESVHLKNGPDVNVNSYGTLVGGDSDFINLGKGWTGVISAFAGYNGSTQTYSNVSTYQNGGVLGATASLYKGKFYAGLTANVGASVGEAHTSFGHDSFTMLMSGIAARTGYSLESKEGRFILQPSMLVGYSFINTFDYTNAAGMRIDSDPLHAIQIAPKVKFITNLENGWQPYAQVGMVWNIMDKTKVMANDVALPQFGIGPYIEYGAGIQRRWAEDNKYSAFGQATVRNGARNGVALTFGFKMMLGKDKVQKVDASTSTKTVVKQLSTTPASRTVIKQQNGSLTAKPVMHNYKG